jgi:hypothetical protein
MRRAAYVLCCAFSLGLAGCISGPWQAQRFPSADPLANAPIKPSPDVASLPQPNRAQTARSERVSTVKPADVDRTGSIAVSAARNVDELPPDTRSRVAQLVAHEYVRDGIGPAEFSISRGNGAATEICVEFPVEKPPYRLQIIPRKPSYVRTIEFSAERGSRGDVVFRRKPGRHGGDPCASAGEATAFLELTRFAAREKECGPSDKSCLAMTEAARPGAAAAAVGSAPIR